MRDIRLNAQLNGDKTAKSLSKCLLSGDFTWTPGRAWWAAVVRILTPCPTVAQGAMRASAERILVINTSSVSGLPHFHAVPHRTVYRYNRIGDRNMKESRETTSTQIFFSLLLRDEEELETREGPVRSPFLSSHFRDKEGGPEKKSAVPVFSHISCGLLPGSSSSICHERLGLMRMERWKEIDSFFQVLESGSGSELWGSSSQ